MPICDDTTILCVAFLTLALVLGLLILGGCTWKGRTIVRDAEADAARIRREARDEAMVFHRSALALWRDAERILRR